MHLPHSCGLWGFRNRRRRNWLFWLWRRRRFRLCCRRRFSNGRTWNFRGMLLWNRLRFRRGLNGFRCQHFCNRRRCFGCLRSNWFLNRCLRYRRFCYGWWKLRIRSISSRSFRRCRGRIHFFWWRTFFRRAVWCCCFWLCRVGLSVFMRHRFRNRFWLRLRDLNPPFNATGRAFEHLPFGKKSLWNLIGHTAGRTDDLHEHSLDKGCLPPCACCTQMRG